MKVLYYIDPECHGLYCIYVLYVSLWIRLFLYYLFNFANIMYTEIS
jgi:hypothetical protein